MVVQLYKELNGVILKNNIGLIQIYEKVKLLIDINIIIIQLLSSSQKKTLNY